MKRQDFGLVAFKGGISEGLVVPSVRRDLLKETEFVLRTNYLSCLDVRPTRAAAVCQWRGLLAHSDVWRYVLLVYESVCEAGPFVSEAGLHYCGISINVRRPGGCDGRPLLQ